jgi:uncharacterized membrane protein YphA (DoxX/SURF4 family)
MNTRKIGYIAATGIVALGFAVGGAADLLHPPNVVAMMQSLGYPAYFATILGTWKLLGAVAIASPRFPRLKEWAYAGMFFDLSGAVLSHVASGQADKIAAPLVLTALLAASWALRPASRKLGAEASAPASARGHEAHGAPLPA